MHNEYYRQLAGISTKPNLFEYSGTGVMVGWFLPKSLAKKVALKQSNAEPASDLHVTFCYLGKKENIPTKLMEPLHKTISNIAENNKMLLGKIGGFGRFTASESSDGTDVLYLSVNVVGLTELRDKIIIGIKNTGFELDEKNGFTPHITLKYCESSEANPFTRVESIPIKIDSLSLTTGSGNKNRYDYALQKNKITH